MRSSLWIVFGLMAATGAQAQAQKQVSRAGAENHGTGFMDVLKKYQVDASACDPADPYCLYESAFKVAVPLDVEALKARFEGGKGWVFGDEAFAVAASAGEPAGIAAQTPTLSFDFRGFLPKVALWFVHPSWYAPSGIAGQCRRYRLHWNDTGRFGILARQGLDWKSAYVMPAQGDMPSSTGIMTYRQLDDYLLVSTVWTSEGQPVRIIRSIGVAHLVHEVRTEPVLAQVCP
jgi:hypothetical protein